MRTTLSSWMTGALTSLLLLSACGSNDEFDLTSLPVVSEDDKTDVILGSSALTWTRPSPSTVMCIRFPCASHMLFDVNTQVSKLVYAYDWRALKLNPNDQQTAETQTANMLLFGRYTPVKVAGEQMQVFQVTRANMRVAMGVSDAPETDRYYSAKAGDPSCASPPCQNLTAQRLNQPKTQPEQWSGVDFSRLSLSQPGTAQLWNELAAGKAYVSVPPGNNKETTILIGQAFRPLQAGPLN